MRMLGIDLAKQSFHVPGISADGEIVSRHVGRQGLPSLIVKLAIGGYGHVVLRNRPLLGAPVHGCRIRGAADQPAFRQALCGADRRTTRWTSKQFGMRQRGRRCASCQTEEQQDLQSLHRVTDRLVAHRTSLINHLCGLLAEYDLIHPKGGALRLPRVRCGLAEARVSAMARETFEAILDELKSLEARIERLDERLSAICRAKACSAQEHEDPTRRVFSRHCGAHGLATDDD